MNFFVPLESSRTKATNESLSQGAKLSGGAVINNVTMK